MTSIMSHERSTEHGALLRTLQQACTKARQGRQACTAVEARAPPLTRHVPEGPPTEYTPCIGIRAAKKSTRGIGSEGPRSKRTSRRQLQRRWAQGTCARTNSTHTCMPGVPRAVHLSLSQPQTAAAKHHAPYLSPLPGMRVQGEHVSKHCVVLRLTATSQFNQNRAGTSSEGSTRCACACAGTRACPPQPSCQPAHTGNHHPSNQQHPNNHCNDNPAKQERCRTRPTIHTAHTEPRAIHHADPASGKKHTPQTISNPNESWNECSQSRCSSMMMLCDHRHLGGVTRALQSSSQPHWLLRS
mmetsp:Transcript_35375/g.89570  ORF Transcript_35375/g.89570 Transcript_35375/m.89570 type:complete len:300 (+) Transcript_35375:474-1373(+)